MKVSTSRVLFQVTLHVVLIGHIAAYYWLDWRRVGGLDFQSFYHDFLGDGILTAGALLALVAFVAALVFGRLFCSWACHFGAFQDAAAWVLRKVGWKPPHVRTRFLHWAPYALLVAIFAAPIARSIFEQGELPAPRVDWTTPAPWSALPGWFGTTVTFLACGVGILLFLGTRGFCRFVCPYGATFRLLEPLSLWRVRKSKPCSGDAPGCASGQQRGDGAVAPCTAACPTAVAVHEETRALGAVRDVDCVRCHLCIEACPQQALDFGPRRPGRAPSKDAAGDLRTARRPTLPLSHELTIATVAVVSFIAWDLTLAAHFLAATLALGEGFLAALALQVVSQRDFRLLGRWSLKDAGRWTFAGATVVGLFIFSLVPLARGVTFKALVFHGDRAFEVVFPEYARAARQPSRHSKGDVEEDRGREPPAVPDPADRRILETRLGDATGSRMRRLDTARWAYSRSLALFPDAHAVRRRLVRVLVEVDPAAARAEARELARRDPDPRADRLLDWVEQRLQPQGAAEDSGQTTQAQ